MTREEVRRELIKSLGSWTSGEEMAASLGISRAAIWKAVASLRGEGYEIEASKRGYRLSALPDLLSEELIQGGLKTRFVGRRLHHHRSITSTNAEAKRIVPSAEDGTVVIAEVQTAGRGRMDRHWESPRGGVWMSIILKPMIPPAQAFIVNIAACVAVARAIEGLYGLDVKVKWPNDLMVGERKVSGILTEIGADMDRLEYAVVGIGINANLDPAALSEGGKATSISSELGREVLRAELVRRVLEELEASSEEMTASSDRLLEEWSIRSATLGRRVRITSRVGEFEGLAEGLEADGSLAVRRDEGLLERVIAGDCAHLRPAGERI